MKKVISVLAVALLVTMLLPATAFAHGHGGGYAGQAAATRYALCTVEDCNITNAHQHDGTWYCGHTLYDGHEYHEVCGVSGCTLAYAHEHDGVFCFPHTANDGHTYHWYGHGHGGRHH